MDKQRTHRDNEESQCTIDKNVLVESEIDDGIFEELQRIFPAFWALLKKTTKDLTKLKKSGILATSGSYKTSLPT